MLHGRLLPIVLFVAAGLCACAEEPPVAPPSPPAAVEAPFPDTMPEILKAIEVSYRSGKYDRGLALVKHALELKRTDVSTYDRIGSVYYVLGRYGDALAFWSRALPLERDEERRAALQRSIADTRASLGLPDEGNAPGPEPAARPAPPPPQPVQTGPVRRADPREVERLYKQGVKFYAQGEYLQATDAFLRVLDLDAGNADARKALERLRHEPGAAAK